MPGMTAALQGNLRTFTLPELFTFFNETKKSGYLEVQSGVRRSGVFFHAGEVIFATANQDQFRLGAILLRQKRISREQLSRIEEALEREPERVGRIAIRQNFITDEELRDCLKIQVSEIIYDSFAWREGTFQFDDERALPDHAVTISLDLPNLIMEGLRRIQEWEHCLSMLPDPQVIFRLCGNPQTEDRITLTVDEWKILFLINGRRTLEQLCADSGEPSLQVYRLVYGLYANRLIEPAPGEGSIEADTPVPQPLKVDPVTALAAADATALGGSASRATVRQVIGVENDLTTRIADDRELLVSPDANLGIRDVVRTLVASLVVRGDGDQHVTYALTDQEYRVGRLRENEIQLFDLAVSGRHARIYRGPDGYVVEDLSSRNGTYVNGLRVDSQLLAPNDVVRFGSTELVYSLL